MSVETLSLINAGQALVLALMLWYGTHGGSRQALKGLRLRALALLAEASADGVVATHAFVSTAATLLWGNTLNLLAQALTVVALRMLMDRPLRWRLVLALGVVGWLGVTWFGVVQPDYPLRTLWGSVIILGNTSLNIAVLWQGGCRRRETRAQCTLLLAYVLAIALLVWRNISLWMLAVPPQGIGSPSPLNTTYVLLLGMQPLLASVGFLLLYNETLQRELYDLARIDPLTGVANRLGLVERADKMLAHARARQSSVGALLIDADHFKSTNDRFGHDGGDRVLLILVATIKQMLRADDVIGRVGGEEFLVLSPAESMADLFALAEGIRAAVERATFEIQGEAHALTVSIGIAMTQADEPDMTAVRRKADTALYMAKHAGRNCVMAADTP